MCICLRIIEGLAAEYFCPQLPIKRLCHVGHFQFIDIHSLNFSCLSGSLHSVFSGIPELSPSSVYYLFPAFQEANCWQITPFIFYQGTVISFSHFPLALLFLFCPHNVWHHFSIYIPKFPDTRINSQSIL